MDETQDEIRLSSGTVAGTPTVNAFLGDVLLFTVTGATDEEAFAKAHRRLGGGGTSTTADDDGRRPRAPEPATALPKGAVWSKDIECQPRTQPIPRPLMFYLEDGADRRPWDQGNGSDSPTSGHHQVDPRRPSSMTPVMPNIVLARSTGNPYPAAYDPATMATTPKYQNLVTVSHVTYQLLRDRGHATVAELLPDVATQIDGLVRGDDLKECIRDTLRDLRLYGLALADGKIPGRARYRWIPPDTVRLANEG